MFVCSAKHGKRTLIGSFSDATDAGSGVGKTVANRDYVAYVLTSSGPAGGFADIEIRVSDLKTGRVVTRTTPIVGPYQGRPAVGNLVLNAKGWIGWSSARWEEGYTSPFQQFYSIRYGQVNRNNRVSSQTLASGLAVDSNFVRFGRDHESLIWSPSTQTASYSVPTGWNPKPTRPAEKSCLKRGERNLSRQPDTVLVERPLRDANVKHGRVMIACYRSLKRRVIMGVLGTYATGTTFEREAIRFDGQNTVGIVVKQTDRRSGAVEFSIKAFDAVSGRLISSSAASEDPATTAVTAFALQNPGVVGWIARQGGASSPDRRFEVHVRDHVASRVVASGSQIDPEFLRFGTFDDQKGLLLWANGTDSG